MEPEGSLPIHKCPPVLILIQIHPAHARASESWRSMLIIFIIIPCKMIKMQKKPTACTSVYLL